MAKLDKTVLVVDDEADILATITGVLKKNGYQTLSALNGAECLKVLQKKTPDLILLDIMMPGKPVREVVRKVKGIKIIYVTAVGISEAEREHLFASGNVVDIIEKPFDLRRLLSAVRKHTS